MCPVRPPATRRETIGRIFPSGLSFLALVGLLAILPLLAHVIPVDQIVMRGIFDEGDGDAVADAVIDLVLARGDMRTIDLPFGPVGEIAATRAAGADQGGWGLSHDRAPPVAETTEPRCPHPPRLRPPCPAVPSMIASPRAWSSVCLDRGCAMGEVES